MQRAQQEIVTAHPSFEGRRSFHIQRWWVSDKLDSDLDEPSMVLLERLLYAAVIACFMIVHYIALQRIDAVASDAIHGPHDTMQAAD